MKSLPVIQPPPPKASASLVEARLAREGGPPVASTTVESSSGQTTGMVNDPEKSATLLPRIVEALSAIFDPEIPVNIYELGLIYDVIVDASSAVGIRMTLTAPACPAAQFLPGHVRDKVSAVAGVADVKVDVVWDPPWTRDRMSETAKLQLGMF